VLHIAKQIKHKKVLITYAFISMTVILLFGLVLTFIYTNVSRIGGAQYKEIMLASSLTADIMPPTEYIVESYAIALEFSYERDLKTRDAMYIQIQGLETMYLKQHSFWEENLPDYGDLRQVFLVESYEHAQTFYDVFYHQIVPAVSEGSVDASIDAQIALKNAYHNHRIAIDKSIVLVDEWRQEVYHTSIKHAQRGISIIVLMVVAMLGLSIPTGLFIYRSEKSLMSMAYYDGLTGLPNRKQFIDKLEDLIAAPNQERFAVVFFDLDGFKQVNDTLGHDAGDVLLREVTARLSAAKYPEDILGRFSGDEFALLINRGLNDSQVFDCIQKLQEVVRKPFVIKHTKAALSASFGVSFFPEDGCTAAELIKRADKAMYKIKSSGGNGVQFFRRIQE
jgi:diguanylate cyclase (GGDEF)-like protein